MNAPLPSNLFAAWVSRRKHRVRRRTYGLTVVGTQLATALSWAFIALIASQMDARGVDVSFWLFFSVLVIAAVFWFWLDAFIERRQRRRDLAVALRKIGMPLRNRRELDGTIVDFDPSYPAVHPNGSFVWALDRRRRRMRLIMSDYVNGDYVWPFDVTMLNADIVNAPPKRRRWGFLSSNEGAGSPILWLAVKIRGRDGVESTHNLAFRRGDRGAAEAWRETLLTWIHQDRNSERVASTRHLDASSLPRHP